MRNSSCHLKSVSGEVIEISVGLADTNTIFSFFALVAQTHTEITNSWPMFYKHLSNYTLLEMVCLYTYMSIHITWKLSLNTYFHEKKSTLRDKKPYSWTAGNDYNNNVQDCFSNRGTSVKLFHKTKNIAKFC